MGNKPISSGHTKTNAYVDENRKSDARFFVIRLQECADQNASPPTVQLQRIRMCLAVIAYRKWNFRVTVVSRAFLMSKPLERNTYANLPEGGEEKCGMGALKTPLWSKQSM